MEITIDNLTRLSRYNMPMKKKKSEHYVDNKKFLAEMVLFKEKCDKAKAKGQTQPADHKLYG